MIRVKSCIDLQELLFHLRYLPKSVDDTGVLMANGQFNRMPGNWNPVCLEACRESERLFGAKVLYVMVNTILPGKRTPRHVDPLPQGRRLERWHLPVETNLDCWLQDSEGSRHLEKGWWHGPVRYWDRHAVGNDGATDRTHFIVDLDLDVP